MGRTTLPETKVQIASRVASDIKDAIDKIAAQGRHTASQAIEILLEESPRIKAIIRNGKKKNG